MARRVLVPLVFILAMVSMIALGGCGNSSSGSAGGSGGASAATALEPTDISGCWIVEKSGGNSLDDMLKLGMLNTLQFDENGGFKIVMRLNDATLEREGTYKIDGGKLYVSVPEMEKQTSGDLSLSAKAIEDAEVTIDGDTLTTNAISNDGGETVAKKATEEQYQKYVDQVVALGPKKPAIGETVTTDTVTFTVNSMSYVDEIYPSDTSGYYTYYEHQDGKSYLLANVTFTNNGTDYAVPGYSTQASFNVAGNKYSGEIEVDAGSRFGKSYSVEAKDTATVYIFCLVPDSVRDSGEAKLTWSIPTSQTYMNTYYKSSFPHDDFVITM